MAGQVFPAAGVPISGRVTPAAFPFYTTGEDNLRIVSRNTAAGVVLRLTARLLGADGRPTPDNWTHTPNTDRSAKSDDVALSGLTLLNLQVSVAAGAPLMGQTYVVVQLIRGIGTAAIVLGTIASGYVSSARAIGWPGSPLESPLDGGGYFRVLTATTPGAGAEIAETVPTGARWYLVSCAATLTTSAAAGTRTPNLYLVGGGLQWFASGQPVNQGASLTQTYWWSVGMPLAAKVGLVGSVAGLPIDGRLLAGHLFQTITTGLQAGDQWANGSYLAQEWLEP